jgi:hypothetical protein
MAYVKKIPDFGTWNALKGKAFAQTFTFKLNGSVINIAGYTANFTVKSDKTLDDSEAEIQKALTITSAPAGQMTLSLSASDMDIAEDDYYACLEYTPSGGSPVGITGRFIVSTGADD